MTALPRAFVLGHPIAHSRSPMLHGFWLQQLGVRGSYEPLDILPEDLESFFAGFTSTGWAGGNVTVPHKSAVIPYLDHLDKNARAMGAVNTIWWDDGKLVGGNTDGFGFIGNLDELVPDWDRNARHAVIIGAGGAARAATHALLDRNISVSICNRTLANAQALARHFNGDVSSHEWGALSELLTSADLLVNTTSLGMSGQPPLTIDLDRLKPAATVYDVVYVPLETALISEARARDHRVAGGLGMLLHQGVFGFEKWFGKTPAVSAELRELITNDILAKTDGSD